MPMDEAEGRVGRSATSWTPVQCVYCETGVDECVVKGRVDTFCTNEDRGQYLVIAWGIDNTKLREDYTYLSVFCPINDKNEVTLRFRIPNKATYSFTVLDLPVDLLNQGAVTYQLWTDGFQLSSGRLVDPKERSEGSGHDVVGTKQLVMLVRVRLPLGDYMTSKGRMEWHRRAKHSLSLIKKLRDTATFADVTFQVKEETFTAHRAVLAAQSEVFQRMFQTGLEEALSGRVHIADATPDEFRTLLDVTYTGGSETMGRHLGALLRLADKYLMVSVTELVLEYGISHLNIENAVATLLAFDTYGPSPEHVDRAIRFIVENRKKVVGGRDWETLEKEQLRKVCAQLATL